MSIYLWSDTHFGHAGILKYCSSTRPYNTVEEMEDGLVMRWNHRVKPTDTIYLLGDFAFGRDVARYFDRLQGHKHLIRGNHDEKNPRVLKLPWESQQDLAVVKEEGARVVVCHYPLETWPSAHHGYLHAHGHSHGTLRRVIPHRWDVGADVEYYPISVQELVTRAKTEAFVAQDHHGSDM